MGYHSIAWHRGPAFVSTKNFIVGVDNSFCRFIAINGVGIYLYVVIYQAQDEEDYGGAWEVLKEGMLTSSAFFVVSVSIWLTIWSTK